MRWASKILSIEQCDPHITLKKSIFSTGCVDRVARSKKLGSKRHFFDCVRMLDLVSDRNPPFSIHLSDCIRIGLAKSHAVRPVDRNGRFPIRDQIGHSDAVEKVPFRSQLFRSSNAIRTSRRKVDFSTGCAHRIARSKKFLKPTASLTTPQDTRSHPTIAPMLA